MKYEVIVCIVFKWVYFQVKDHVDLLFPYLIAGGTKNIICPFYKTENDLFTRGLLFVKKLQCKGFSLLTHIDLYQ